MYFDNFTVPWYFKYLDFCDVCANGLGYSHRWHFKHLDFKGFGVVWYLGKLFSSPTEILPKETMVEKSKMSKIHHSYLSTIVLWIDTNDKWPENAHSICLVNTIFISHHNVCKRLNLTFTLKCKSQLPMVSKVSNILLFSLKKKQNALEIELWVLNSLHQTVSAQI